MTIGLMIGVVYFCLFAILEVGARVETEEHRQDACGTEGKK